MVSFDAVSKFILDDVSIHIPSGETVGLIGASGAGKTTFIKLASGLLIPEKGRVYTLGKSMGDPGVDVGCAKRHRALGKKIGVLFADKSMLDKEESVMGNLENLRIAYGLSQPEFHREYAELAARLGFAEYAGTKVKTLSLGQRRRVELGAVLLHRPQLLLLDEPTNGLDANAKEVFRELIEERTGEGMSIVITSHNMADISRLCSRIAILHQGKRVYYGSQERLLRSYAPTDIMHLKLQGKLPDMTDLPLQEYEIQNDELTITYNSNHVTSAEILSYLLEETSVTEVKIHKPDLRDVIVEIERKSEGYE